MFVLNMVLFWTTN